MALRIPLRTQLVLVFTVPSVVMLVLATLIYGAFRIDVPDRLSPDARVTALASLRAAFDGGDVVRPAHSELDRALEDRGPVIASVWRAGKLVFRVEGRGDTTADAIVDAGQQLRVLSATSRMSPGAKTLSRIKVDVVVGRGPFLGSSDLFAMMSLHPGLEGIGVSLGSGQEALITAEELVDRRLLYAKQPLKFIPDLNFGFNFEGADVMLAVRAGLPLGAYGERTKRYFRLRSDTFVEQTKENRDKAPIAITRGHGPRPELTEANLRAAAIAGGRYLVAHMAKNGRYIYETNVATGRSTNPKQRHPYSLPRHAGTTYFLAELYRITGEDFLREPIERAFAHLSELLAEGSCDGVVASGAEFACVADKGQIMASLGSTALTVVALVEYKRATGSDKYDALTRRFAEWILYMQRDDGSFRHVYDTRARRPDEEAHLLYYSGEAALALARLYTIYKEERYRIATEKALDNLVGWYGFFAGAFFFGEEHWTCIAAEAAYPHVKNDDYRRFCDGYGKFLGAQQPLVGDFPDQPDLAGTYGFTPFIIPNNTPAGSRTEATISSYLLGAYYKKANPELRQQILRAMHFTLGQQIREDTAWSIPAIARGLGGISGSPVDRKVRIDYVQHICSAMIRTAELLKSESEAKAP